MELDACNKKQTTRAFEIIDAVSLIRSEIYFDVPRYVVNNISDGTANYLDEQVVCAAICKRMAEKSTYEVDFEEIKKAYKGKVKALASKDIDLIKFKKAKKQLDDALFAYAKLEYCKREYLSDLVLTNDFVIAGIMVSIYNKIMKAKNLSGSLKKTMFSRSKVFKYVRSAMLEENGVDILSAYNGKSFFEMVEVLFDHLMLRQYELQNTVEETMLAADGHNYNLQIHIIEENNEFEAYKKSVEMEVYAWLVDEMHRLEDGMYF